MGGVDQDGVTSSSLVRFWIWSDNDDRMQTMANRMSAFQSRLSFLLLLFLNCDFTAETLTDVLNIHKWFRLPLTVRFLLDVFCSSIWSQTLIVFYNIKVRNLHLLKNVSVFPPTSHLSLSCLETDEPGAVLCLYKTDDDCVMKFTYSEHASGQSILSALKEPGQCYKQQYIMLSFLGFLFWFLAALVGKFDSW